MFFFFKQKTGYEMRISDWSSDVCSSDLLDGKELRRSERQREVSHERCQESQDDDGEEGADERRGESSRQRLAGAPLLRHGIAVEGGGYRPRLPWNVDSERGVGAAQRSDESRVGEESGRTGRYRGGTRH